MKKPLAGEVTNQSTKTMNQTDRLRAALDSGQVINRLNALTDLGIFELSARICELKKMSYPVQKRKLTIVNRWGERVKVMGYFKLRNKEPRVWPLE